ncbi:MAG: metallophosphoesterase, partial [Oscillospiraceae bacterium]|nr:metallophosphoesterase [Oscillospiraceae bacterium]
MPKWKKTAATLLAAFSFFGSGCAAIPDPGEAAVTDRPDSTPAQYRVLTATDLHYLAPSLTDHGALFWQVMEAGDGKVTEYCDEITSAFLEEAAALQPDALILTGDLTFNGEEASHLALAEKLAAAE